MIKNICRTKIYLTNIIQFKYQEKIYGNSRKRIYLTQLCKTRLSSHFTKLKIYNKHIYSSTYDDINTKHLK